MGSMIRRAMVVAGTVMVLLGFAVGVASATVAVSWSPSGSFDYGTLSAAHRSSSRAFTLTNSGSSATSALKIALTTLTSRSSAFTKAADTCTGTSLGPKKSCSVTVTYTVTASSQSDQATLSVASNKPAASASVTLLGASAKAAATSLRLGLPSSITAGTPGNLTVTVVDAFENPVTGYTGTVHFAGTDPLATLAADYTYTATDNGVHTFSVTLRSTGSQTVTATDTVTSSITGSVQTMVNP